MMPERILRQSHLLQNDFNSEKIEFQDSAILNSLSLYVHVALQYDCLMGSQDFRIQHITYTFPIYYN